MARRHEVLKRSPAAVRLRRAVAIAATAAVLAVGALSLSMIFSGGEDEKPAARPPAQPVASAEPPKPHKPRLSARQRADRRAAIDRVRREGYTPVKLSDYRADHELRVLIGEPVGTTPAGRRGFFFVGDEFVGADSQTGTLKLRPGRQLEREITLVYTLFEPGDRSCCPGGGDERVHFRWSDGALVPRELIPAAEARLPAVRVE